MAFVNLFDDFSSLLPASSADRDTRAICRTPIAVHTGLAEVPVRMPRVRCRLAYEMYAKLVVSRTESKTFSCGKSLNAFFYARGNLARLLPSIRPRGHNVNP
jgi:hypothetical protein